MKRLGLIAAAAIVLGMLLRFLDPFADRSASDAPVVSEPFSEAAEGTPENPLARLEFDWQRLHDPATGAVPLGIAQGELAFARRLARQTQGQALTDPNAWTARGPHNIGGRTRALAIDVTDESVLVAGGFSSGMFRSTDGGASWTKTTAPNQLHSVTTVAQNKAPGRTHIWYYGTGDRAPTNITNTAGLLGTNAFYRGDGIFKSVDGGASWTQLPSTVSGTPHQTDTFDFVWHVLTFGEDGVLAATSAGVFKSIDGGATWTESLQFDDPEAYPSMELAVAADGVYYVAVGGDGPDNGVYRSVDLEDWTNITPAGWPEATVRTVLSPAPSNPNIVYFFTEVTHLNQQLRKYEAGAGWTDLTGNLPFDAQMLTFTGKMMVIAVKPDDEDTIFLGAVDLFRSMDGGQSFELISGTGSAEFHVDQHAITFYPSDPNRMIAGNDGGLFRTDDNTAPTSNQHIDWSSLNNGFLTTQFYTVAIDQRTAGSEMLVGGTQDNGVVFTASADPQVDWQILFGGDGAYAAITDGGERLYYATAATFRLYRHSFPNGGWEQTNVTPASGRLGLWLTVFQVDPHDERVMYLPSQRTLFRNSDLTAVPHQTGGGPTDVNWDTFEHVQDHFIHALGMSEAEPRRLYYAAADVSAEADERVFVLENPHEGQPVPVDITGENFPFYPYAPYINCIAVDPRDANRVMVVFPSYGVLSIFASDDGGANWTPVSGTLEENPDGSGSGPSVRWVEIVYVQDRPVYLAGTSVGLFSATELDGMNTRWIPEATTTIGNVVVDMIDARQVDGYVAVATHGNGIYTTTLTQVPTDAESDDMQPATFELLSAYPNPFNPATTIRYRLPRAGHVTARVYDVRGRRVATLVDSPQPAGQREVRWEARHAAGGTYFVEVAFEGAAQVEKVVLVK